MSSKSDKSAPQDPTMNVASPYFLHPTDTGLKIVPNVFSGTGFKGWKISISIALSGKNKMGFVDGSVKKSTSNAMYSKAWDKVNDVVLGWLLGVVDEKFFKRVLWFKTAKEVWGNLEARFGSTSSAQLFSIEEQLSKAYQKNEMTIEDFFTKLKGLWDEIDALDPLPICSCTGCACDLSQKTQKSQQRRRIIQFLMKLDSRYQHTRSNILMMKDMPTAAEVISILTQEQTHQEFSKGTITDYQEAEVVCRTEKTKYLDSNKYKPKTDFKNKKPNTQLFCDPCKIQGHTIDKFWKIHGYPSNFKPNSWKRNDAVMSRANNTSLETNVQETVAEPKLTQEQYNQLLSLISKRQAQLDNKDSTSTSTHFAGNSCLKSQCFNSWILDSGASDHICFDKNMFHELKKPHEKEHFILIPNGKRIKVNTIGAIKFANGLTLNNVLYAPGFKFNLISVNKLAKDMKCKVWFDDNQCFIQGHSMMKHLLLCKAKNGLYYLDPVGPNQNIDDKVKHKSFSATTVNTQSIQELKIWNLR
ncbi:unnamed protein product [Amaranthus hypochondriacus]